MRWQFSQDVDDSLMMLVVNIKCTRMWRGWIDVKKNSTACISIDRFGGSLACYAARLRCWMWS